MSQDAKLLRGDVLQFGKGGGGGGGLPHKLSCAYFA